MTTTAAGPRVLTAARQLCWSASTRPLSARASGRFGVATVALGRIVAISAWRASASSSSAPDSATITGSTTSGVPAGSSSSALATAATVSALPSIPILTASMPMSEATARTWATIMSGGTLWTAVTPTVFCAVIAVTAVMP